MELLDIQKPTQKIYSDKVILAGTFLGGPIVAAYFMASNFKVFGLPDNARKTWIYAVVATIVIFGGVFLIPGIEKFPRMIIPLVYTGVVYYLVQKHQLLLINSHIHARR